MGHRRSSYAALLTPCTSIKDPRQCGQHYILPVEVRKAEQNRCCYQRPARPQPPLQQVLHPPAEENLLGNCDKEKRKHPRQYRARDRGKFRMKMQKPHREAKDDRNRSIHGPLTQPDSDVGGAKAEIEPHTLQPADRKKSIETGIEQ